MNRRIKNFEVPQRLLQNSLFNILLFSGFSYFATATDLRSLITVTFTWPG